MVETAIFSIFHRTLPPPAPPPAEPVGPADVPQTASIVDHPLLSNPAIVKPEEPSPGSTEPTEPEPAPPSVAETAPPVPEPAEAMADHAEIPAETAAPVQHEPAEAPEPAVEHPEIPADTAVLAHHQPAAAALPEPEPSAEEDVAQAHAVAVAPVEEIAPELVEQEIGEPEFTDEPVLLAEPESEPHHETVAEQDFEEEAEPVVIVEPAPADALEAPAALEPASDHLIEADRAIEMAEPPHVALDYATVAPPPPDWADQAVPVDAPHDPAAEPAWHGPATLANIPVDADQLGLANPIVITLLARLEDSSAVELDASQSGIYRPQSFRAAPWSGFAYDQAKDGRTGVAAGTRILTSRGELEVEKLLPGDTVLTLRAPALLPIAWIGKCVATATPIWIEAGALGPNLPRRGLCIAADQPVYVDPIPVPAAKLVNGTTIRVVETEDVDLFHVDVGKSEILFAEGLPLSSSDRTRLQRA